MIYKGSFTVVIDACVLYPASLRDLLLRLAAEYLYRPKWTEEINDEWKRNLLGKRNDITSESLDYTIQEMNRAFKDAEIVNYKQLIKAIDLPDSDDEHVLAAAIKCNADLILTENLKDFPEEELAKYEIEAQKPDTFIQNLIDLDLEACCKALSKQREALNNPPQSKEDMRATLQNVGLTSSADLLFEKCQE